MLGSKKLRHKDKEKVKKPYLHAQHSELDDTSRGVCKQEVVSLRLGGPNYLPSSKLRPGGLRHQMHLPTTNESERERDLSLLGSSKSFWDTWCVLGLMVEGGIYTKCMGVRV